MSISPPNGRLPASANYLMNSSIPMPSHIAQLHPTPMANMPPFSLDGGVYQGQSPVQAANWSANARVSPARCAEASRCRACLTLSRSSCLDHHLPQFLFLNSVQTIIAILISHMHKKLCHQRPTMRCRIHAQVCTNKSVSADDSASSSR